MAQEIASGYVTLLPSARGMSKGIQKEFDGEFDAVEKKGSSAIGGLFKKAVGFAAGAAVAIGGYFSAKKIFGGGLDRLMNIEDAQAKLKGLGHDADTVSQIMADALASVRGTAYGLDSAATTAASAVAAGIKPGQELERYLKLTADAATIAGTSMDEMGSIINKVTTSGFAMTDNLNQLADRGIPIFQWLQDEYGVTAEELRKMVSSGQVDAETFRRVIEENIGGAALASGDTTRGAMANMGAALSRVGANLLGGVFPLFRETFVGITNLLGPVETQAKAVGDAFGEWATGTAIPAVQGLADLFRGDFTPALREALGWEEDSGAVNAILSVRAVAIGLGDTLQGIVSVIRDGDFNGSLFAWLGASEDSGFVDTLFRIREAAQGIAEGARGGIDAMVAAFQAGGNDITSSGIAGFLESLGLAARNFVDPLSEAFGGLFEAIGPVLPQVLQAVTAFNPLSLVFKALQPLIPQIATVLGELVAVLVGALGPLIAQVVPVLAQVASILVEGLATAFAALLPVIVQFLPIITSLVGILGGALLAVVQAVAPLLVTLAGVVAQLLPVVMSLIPVVLSIVQALLPVVQIVADLIGALLPPLVALFMALLGPILDLIAPLVSALAPVLALVGDLVGGVLAPVLALLAALLVGLLKALMPVIGALLGGLVTALTAVIRWVAQALAGIATFVSGGIRAVGDFARAVGNSIGDAIQWFRDLPSKISGIFSNAGTWLLSAGRKIIDGLIDGLKGAFNRVKDTLSGLTDLLPDWKGPADRDRRLLFGAGQLIIGGLVEGLESKYGAVERSLSGLTDDISGMSAGLSASVNLNGAAGAFVGNGSQVNQTNHIYGLDPESAVRHFDARLRAAMIG